MATGSFVNLDIGKAQRSTFNSLRLEHRCEHGNPSFGEAYVQNTTNSATSGIQRGRSAATGRSSLAESGTMSLARPAQWVNGLTPGNAAEYAGPGPFNGRPAHIPANTDSLTLTEPWTHILQWAAGQADAALCLGERPLLPPIRIRSQMDIQSDPEGGEASPNVYNSKDVLGASEYNISQMFVFSGVYQLPFDRAGCSCRRRISSSRRH